MMDYAAIKRQYLYMLHFLLLLISLLLAPLHTKATVLKDVSNTVSDIADAISSITCESASFVSMGLRGKFTNTCIPNALSTMAISNILSPGIFAMAMTHVKISDQNLSILSGNCERKNRANYLNPTITFAMCSNVQLMPLKAVAAAKATASATISLFSGENVLDAVKSAWNVDPNDYHESYLDKGIGYKGVFLDVSFIPNPDRITYKGPVDLKPPAMTMVPLLPLPLKVIKMADKICVATLGIFGYMPVGCKYIHEPYPTSLLYGNFFNGNNNASTDALNLGGFVAMRHDHSSGNNATMTTSDNNATMTTNCSGAGSCYSDAVQMSQTPTPISGPLIYCIRQMLVKVLLSDSVCSFQDFNNNPGLDTSNSTLFGFQKNMRNAVTAFLTLYTIFFGLNILLNVGGEMPNKGEIVMFPIKIILVLYFAVGININNNGRPGTDGMTSWVLPIVFDGANQLASWIMQSSAPSAAGVSSTLCNFTVDSYARSGGDSRMMLWDALDCRVSNYLGIDAVKDVSNVLATSDPLSFSVPPWMYFLAPAVYSGNVSLVMLVLMYPILVISVAAYTVNAFVVCMIAITILGVLAPLFIPMALFEYTKGYFDGWVKLLISFVLQPMVVSTFMILMFSVYDAGVYTGCMYKVSHSNGKTTFRISNDKNDYANAKPSANITGTAYEQCHRSLGWMLNSRLYLATSAVNIANSVITGKDDILSSIEEVGGAFFAGPLGFTDPEAIKDLVISFLMACFLLYIMYNLSAQISEFAADMTEGISVGGLSINPQTIIKKALWVGDKVAMARDAVKKPTPAGKRPPAAPMALGKAAPPMALGAQGNTPPPPTALSGSSGKANSSTPPPPTTTNTTTSSSGTNSGTTASPPAGTGHRVAPSANTAGTMPPAPNNNATATTSTAQADQTTTPRATATQLSATNSGTPPPHAATIDGTTTQAGSTQPPAPNNNATATTSDTQAPTPNKKLSAADRARQIEAKAAAEHQNSNPNRSAPESTPQPKLKKKVKITEEHNTVTLIEPRTPRK